MQYSVVVKQTEEGYSVWVPGLPGCWSQGSSEAEALENIEDAIAGYLEVAADIASKQDGATKRVIEVKVA